MKDHLNTDHQLSIDLLEGEIRLATRHAVRRYQDATGRVPQKITIEIANDGGDEGPGVEVTTVQA